MGNFKGLKLDPETFTVSMVWHAYALCAFKDMKVGKVQHDETKQAYYAGFLDCFRVMRDITADMDEDAACVFLTRLEKETELFFEGFFARTSGLPTGPVRQ